MDQQWRDTVAREHEWIADQLRTPWAVSMDQGEIRIIDNNGDVIARMVGNDNSTAALAAREIIGLVNGVY